MKEYCLSKGHPIDTLEMVRAHYKSKGIKIQVRYRGPRRKSASGRISPAGRMICLKQDAHSFAVYPR
jgi:hypothetical protein